MSRKIDLHQMDSVVALRVFVQKYNSMIKNNLEEIEVIHGYGASFLDSKGVIKEKLRNFLRRNKDLVTLIIPLNQGSTIVIPKKPLPMPIYNQKRAKNKKRKINS